MKLVRYDAACHALAEAKSVDEVKDIRDKAIAMQAYGRQAKNKDLEADATEIRMRATRRLGQLMEDAPKTKGGEQYHTTGFSKNPVVATLEDQGIDKNLAHNARKFAALSEEQFEAAVGEAREVVTRGERETLEAAKAIRAEKAKERYAARVARIAEVCANNAPLASERRYPGILADPPWDYRVYNEVSGSQRTAAEHYPTMKLEKICTLPVADTATDDAILFLWTTAPHLKESFEVLAAWGFEYKTHAVWVKHAQGLGFFVRGQHELLLIATKGNIPCPLPGNRPSSVIESPRREHSRKPDEAYELIERMYPELPKIELFARNAREGWAAWGNQTNKFEAA